jgi:hypothetical protein
MPVTPDRFPGSREEDEIIFEENSSDPGDVGAIRYVSGGFRAKDGIGVFDLRSGGGITEAQHSILRQLIHFIDNGPAEGFASGAYREMVGTVFPTAIIWWESSAKLKKIVEKLLTWTGATPTTIVWKVYAADGVAVLATVTDAISYSGPFEVSRVRTIV